MTGSGLKHSATAFDSVADSGAQMVGTGAQLAADTAAGASAGLTAYGTAATRKAVAAADRSTRRTQAAERAEMGPEVSRRRDATFLTAAVTAQKKRDAAAVRAAEALRHRAGDEKSSQLSQRTKDDAHWHDMREEARRYAARAEGNRASQNECVDNLLAIPRANRHKASKWTTYVGRGLGSSNRAVENYCGQVRRCMDEGKRGTWGTAWCPELLDDNEKIKAFKPDQQKLPDLATLPLAADLQPTVGLLGEDAAAAAGGRKNRKRKKTKGRKTRAKGRKTRAKGRKTRAKGRKTRAKGRKTRAKGRKTRAKGRRHRTRRRR